MNEKQTTPDNQVTVYIFRDQSRLEYQYGFDYAEASNLLKDAIEQDKSANHLEYIYTLSKHQLDKDLANSLVAQGVKDSINVNIKHHSDDKSSVDVWEVSSSEKGDLSGPYNKDYYRTLGEALEHLKRFPSCVVENCVFTHGTASSLCSRTWSRVA